MRRVVAGLVLLALVGASAAQKPKPPAHYLVKPGEFPDENAARAMSGELIALDRINRTGVFRVDRTDALGRAFWDLPIPFEMLPYGSVWFHGAPAELRDIPLGTHLHGLFYYDPAVDQDTKTKELVGDRRLHPDCAFRRVLRLEDDFTQSVRRKRFWRIDALDLEKKTVTATGVEGEDRKPDARAEIFQVNDATRFWKGDGYGRLADLKVGDAVVMNFTFRTMRLSGRITDVWLDEASRNAATARQLEVHRLYQREHGLAGWIDEVDNKARTMTVTLFEGFDPKLKDEFAGKVLVKEQLVPAFVAIAVAEDSLRSYDPVNDVKRGPILETKSAPVVAGSSGWRITCQPDLMLEGFRPGRIVRLYAGSWGVTDLPREEKLFP